MCMTNAYQTLRRPTRADLQEIGDAFGMQLTDEELSAMMSFIDGIFEEFERVNELNSTQPGSPHSDRRVLGSPPPEADPYNAIITQCSIPGADEGPLTGYDIGLKDSIAVSGVEMTCGSTLFTGFVPNHDATIVERLLDAGATITAKLNMEDLSYSGSGELSAHGPVRNPHNPEYLAGGSSSGSAAAVAGGLVDAAIGADQGGSIRMPAAWCGVVGLKPTFGLVPYTGIVALDPTIDYTGPITRTVEDCARLLEVLAGSDGLDPRQQPVKADDYLDSLNAAPTDLTIGVLTEGFDREETEQPVDESVQNALDVLADEGATVRDVSVPMHDDGPAILNAIYMEGATALVEAEGIGHHSRGYYDEQFAVAFGRARRENAADLPPMFKLSLVVGKYMAEEYHGRYYARGQNLLRELTTAYDDALVDVDVLALPTTPHSPHPVDEDASLEQLMERSLSMNNNTSPFNGSGHPAITVPCGRVENNLPVGLMLVAEEFAETILLQAAQLFEGHLDFSPHVHR